jgi:hypothetical protein
MNFVKILFSDKQPDQFLGAEQQERLAQLMNDWREARDQGSEFPNDKYLELRALVDAELEATAERATALFEG